MNSSTSFLRGIEGIAPNLVMQRKAELLPNSMAWRQLLASFYALDQSSQEWRTANAPVKQSPAPTVSMILQSDRTVLLIAVTTSPFTKIVGVIIADPFEPSFRRTLNFGCLASNFPRISSTTASKFSLTTIELSNLSSSVSLGEMQVILSSNSSGMSSSLPPQSKMTIFPLPYAYFAAARLISMGTSF